jgi:hypothetical protein
LVSFLAIRSCYILLRSARKISGMAIRHCVELGYHRSTECYRPNADTLTKEMLKRCFWVAYDIDRVAAFILGRPVGIPEDSIDVEVLYTLLLISLSNRLSFPWILMMNI